MNSSNNYAGANMPKKTLSKPSKTPSARPPASVASRLLSTKYATSSTDCLGIRMLADMLAKARKVFVASAFYDQPFCEALLKQVPTSAKSVRLLFNGLGGARLVDQRDELTRLQQTLRRRRIPVEIRLAFASGIFHSKLFLIDNPKGTIALVGSANATMAAMTVNEEILVEVPAHGALETYAERVWAMASPLTDLEERLTATNLIGFFRTGSLYFKPTTSLQTTLNPFSELLRGLSGTEREKLGGAALPFADPADGVGAFNLKRALGMTDAAADVEDGEKTSASVKPFSIETCFGYWVPRALDAELQASLGAVAKRKRAHWLDVKQRLEKTGDRELGLRYARYVSNFRKLLVDRKVQYSIPRANPGSLPKRGPFDPKIFTGFLERVMRSLDSDDVRDRLCAPFVSGSIPELWNDPVAYEDFESSFFEYIEYVANNPNKRKPRVPSRILSRIGQGPPATPEKDAIKDELVVLLESKGWTEGDWKPKQHNEADEDL